MYTCNSSPWVRSRAICYIGTTTKLVYTDAFVVRVNVWVCASVCLFAHWHFSRNCQKKEGNWNMVRFVCWIYEWNRTSSQLEWVRTVDFSVETEPNHPRTTKKKLLSQRDDKVSVFLFLQFFFHQCQRVILCCWKRKLAISNT